MAELSEATLPSISDFYAHKDVLITGATGFMGKCLLEKILRGVPELGTVFVLTRSKKDKSPEQRTKDLLNGPVSFFTCSFIVRVFVYGYYRVLSGHNEVLVRCGRVFPWTIGTPCNKDCS